MCATQFMEDVDTILSPTSPVRTSKPPIFGGFGCFGAVFERGRAWISRKMAYGDNYARRVLT